MDRITVQRLALLAAFVVMLGIIDLARYAYRRHRDSRANARILSDLSAAWRREEF